MEIHVDLPDNPIDKKPITWYLVKHNLLGGGPPQDRSNRIDGLPPSLCFGYDLDDFVAFDPDNIVSVRYVDQPDFLGNIAEVVVPDFLSDLAIRRSNRKPVFDCELLLGIQSGGDVCQIHHVCLLDHDHIGGST